MQAITARFITFEGGEGTGKTTQARLLAERLRAAGHKVLETREPGGTEGAEAIRQLLLTGDARRWDGLCELLLICAARRDHVQKVIQPALAEGAVVLCDRFVDSTLAYQGYAQGLGAEAVLGVHQLAVGHLMPDLTFLMDLPVETGLARAGKRREGDSRFEKLDPGFHERVRRAFLEIATAHAERFAVLDASASEQALAGLIWRKLHDPAAVI